MKIDIKMIIIIVLAVVVIGFIMFGGKGGVDSESYEQERAEMQAKIDSLEVLKNGTDLRIGELEKDYSKILIGYEKKVIENDSLTKQIEYQNSVIIAKTKEYDKAQKKVIEMKKRLSDLKENPPNREGAELINNLQKLFN